MALIRLPQRSANWASSSADVDVGDFFRQNTWANLELIAACSSLTDRQLDTVVEGTYGSIRDTFVHILTAEAGYARRLGRTPDQRLPWDQDWPGFDALTAMARANGDAFVDVAELDGAELVEVGGKGDSYSVQMAVIAVQAFHHGTEHRGQIATVMTTLEVEPPELSSWEWGLATGRMMPLD